jgi:glycosyltransferase involved in cell wall biosynthesis
MKITLLSTYHLNGGAGVAATRLHRALLKSGVESSLLVEQVTKPEPGVIPLADSYLDKKWATARFGLDRLSFLPHEKDKSVRFHFSPATIGANLSHHPAVLEADVLHIHWTNFGFLSLSELDKLVRLGKPIVWTLHDQWAFTGGCHYTRGCTRFLTQCGQCPYLRNPGPNDLSARVFARKAAILTPETKLHIVTPSKWMADEAGSSQLLEWFPVSTIPNTLDQTVFRPIDRQAALNRFGLTDPNRPRLLFGSFNTTDPRKGFQYFADALTLLQQQQPSLNPEILVFGKGQTDAMAALPYPVRQLGVLTSDDDLVAAYNLADALVVPSLEDNLPNTVVESLSCGTPVVAFRTGGIPEMISQFKNGYLADVGSIPKLTNGLAFILNHPTPADLRQNARESAEKLFGEEEVGRRHVELYRSLMSE